MTLRFVKTSILSSADGIDFANEVAVESEDVLKARVEAAAAAAKPLYQQLSDLRDKKQEEYDEVTKQIYAPPRGLDEDEVEFFNDLEDSKARIKAYNKRIEDSELEAFRESQRIEIFKEPSETAHSHAALNIFQTKKVEKPMNVGITLKG
jgi:hypothetical protein